MESVPERSFLEQFDKSAEEVGLASLHSRSDAIVLDNSVSADCLEKSCTYRN